MSLLKEYLERVPSKDHHLAAVAFWATFDYLKGDHPELVHALLGELADQRRCLKLIASENYSSLAVQLAMGNWFSDKYCEGFPFHRFYAGCSHVDRVEDLAVSYAKELYGVDHAYVQPHSGADANLVAYWAVLVHRIQNREVERLGKKSVEELSPEEYERIRQLMVGQKMLGLSLEAGGHLTHGFRRNVSSKMFQAISYGVDPATERIDYKKLEEIALRERPLLLVAGYSSYPRLINFAVMKEIAHRIGAVLVVDMAHFAGLIAGGVWEGEYHPVPYADLITSTTHKTLRGPRGGMVLCTQEYREVVDRGCPLVLGGPLPHVMGAKLVAFREAALPSFKDYAHQVVANSRALAERLLQRGVRLVTGGTDNHLVLIDVYRSFGLTGRQAETVLESACIRSNRNMVPGDPNGSWYTSGIRLGTPALTSRGLKEGEMRGIADLIVDLLQGSHPGAGRGGAPSLSQVEVEPSLVERTAHLVGQLIEDYPLYPELGLTFSLEKKRGKEERGDG